MEPPRTTYAHGLVTPSCDPVMDDRHMHDLIPTLNALTTYDDMHNGPHITSNMPVIDWQSSNLGPNVSLPYTADLSVTYPWPSNISTTYDINTAPSSPAFLPFPDLGQPLLTDGLDAGGGEELVGMGLYDSPAEVQSSLIFGGDIARLGKKSLKLEESFEPQPASDVEENEESCDELDPTYTNFLLSEPHPASSPASNLIQTQPLIEAMVAPNIRSSMAQFTANEPQPLFYEDFTGWI